VENCCQWMVECLRSFVSFGEGSKKVEVVNISKQN
jgi:hypothetical protein